MSIAVLWFKRDLRIADNPALVAAARSGLPLLPLFVFEPELLAQDDTSARQYGFVLDALADLKLHLADLGLQLHTPIAPIEQVLADLHREHRGFQLFSHEETGNMWTYRRDLRVRSWCKEHSVRWQEFRQNGVIRRMTSRDGWAEKWDAFMAEPASTVDSPIYPATTQASNPLPSLEDLPIDGQDCAGRLSGRRQRGEALLQSFLHTRGHSYQRNMSSPLSAEDSCSRLSPYLAWGVLSTKEVAQATWNRLRQITHLSGQGPRNLKRSLNAYAGRLHWRCHFMQKLEDQPSIEFEALHHMYERLRPRPAETELLTAWQTGNSGYPFLDAAIRYLNHHGWINFRMRAMIMAVASYHLWLDWRDTGHHLARQFVDYEAGIHWPQVQMQSGTTGMNAIRIYNPVKQGYDQDPEGIFIRRWVPELANLPKAFLHEPWKWPNIDKTGYPNPLFNHETSAKHAREKIWAVRQQAGFRDTRDGLLVKHASRRGRDALEGKKHQSTRQRKPHRNKDQFQLF